MQEIFNFVKANWELIAAILTFIVSVIIACIRKKPVSDIMSAIYDYVVYAVDRFEQPGNGEKKKQLVIDFVKECLSNVFPGLDVSKYENTISKTIEKVLSTPQKKK